MASNLAGCFACRKVNAAYCFCQIILNLQNKIVERVLPTVLLYLGHKERSLVVAAHSLCCAIFQYIDQVSSISNLEA